jgi:hypothetical protein
VTDTPPPLSVESGDIASDRARAHATLSAVENFMAIVVGDGADEHKIAAICAKAEELRERANRELDECRAAARQHRPLSTSTPTVQSTEGLREARKAISEKLGAVSDSAAEQAARGICLCVGDDPDMEIAPGVLAWTKYRLMAKAALSASSPVQSTEVQGLIDAISAIGKNPHNLPEHGAWDRGRRRGLEQAVQIIRDRLSASSVEGPTERPPAPTTDGEQSQLEYDLAVIAGGRVLVQRDRKWQPNRLYFVEYLACAERVAALASKAPTPAVEGPTEREKIVGLDGNAVRRIIQSVLGADFRLPGCDANRIAAAIRDFLTPTGSERND